MRKIVLSASVLLLVSAFPTRAQHPAGILEGTWEIVSQRLIYSDSVVDRSAQVATTLKILNATHFAFGRQLKDAEEVIAGGGRYTFDGETYTEHILYHSADGLAGSSIPFKARIEGDLWYHTGRVGSFEMEEVWRRVGAPTSD
jgi:hypothetical protein